MSINTDLLIAAPMLQDYLVNKDSGLPLVGGIVSLYKDNARSYYKNWYYQTGTPGTYTWVALDNPLTLSSVGTIQDPNGNDVIPFYYPYSEDDEGQAEPYYITVYDADAMGTPTILQFTRENFPYNPSGQNSAVVNSCWRNYIINNVFWRNIGSLDAMNVTDQVICPSQHDGYTNGDIRFIKDITGGNDDLIFTPVTSSLPTAGTPNGAITPELMLNFICSGVQLGEGVKCIQYPASLHVKTLNSVQGSIVFYGQAASGSSNGYVDLYFYQYTGTGALASSTLSLIQRVNLNNTMQRYVVPFVTPSTDTLTAANLGKGGDDALFVRVQYPLSAVCEINHTKMQIYFSDNFPDNDFDTYDQIETIINSPRTGDYKTSLNSFQPFGYVSANNGTIGSSTSGASTRANSDAWPLYNLLWSGVNDTFAPVSTGRGSTAYADFSANKTITLTKALGRVTMGLPTSSTFTYDHLTSLLTIADTTLYYVGSPVLLSNSGGGLPPAFTASTIYYVIPVSATTFKLAASYANALAGTAISAGASDGTGTQTISFALGGSFGESRHAQLLTELAAHTHNVTVSTNQSDTTVGSGHTSVGYGTNSGSGASTFTSTTTGSSASFNVIQPSTYLNMFIKL